MIENESSDGKLKVTSYSDFEALPQASAFVEVNIVGNTSEIDVCTSRFYNLDNKDFAVPATLLTGQKGFIRIYNMGQEQLTWKKGDLITQAVPCEMMPTKPSETRGDKSDGAILQVDKIKVRN